MWKYTNSGSFCSFQTTILEAGIMPNCVPSKMATGPHWAPSSLEVAPILLGRDITIKDDTDSSCDVWCLVSRALWRNKPWTETTHKSRKQGTATTRRCMQRVFMNPQLAPLSTTLIQILLWPILPPGNVQQEALGQNKPIDFWVYQHGSNQALELPAKMVCRVFGRCSS